MTENLFGDILSDVTTALTGSLGLGGSSNIGYHGAMFEAIHGTGPSILPGGRDNPGTEHIANPSGLLQAALLMLEHIGGKQNLKAKEIIQRAWLSTLEDGLHTRDLATAMNGEANPTTKKVLNTNEFTGELINRIRLLKNNQHTPIEKFSRLLDSTTTQGAKTGLESSTEPDRISTLKLRKKHWAWIFLLSGQAKKIQRCFKLSKRRAE